jgi:Ca-activated chloride channel homolog
MRLRNRVPGKRSRLKQALQLTVLGFLLLLAILAVAQDAPVKYPRPPIKGSGQTNTSTQTSAANASTDPPASEQTFKVDVKLVNVYVTVQDQHGSPVAGLTKDNFKLSEDGVPQNIAVFGRESELPLSILLSIDASLSTKKDMPLELASARKFAHDIVRPTDRLAVFQFSERVDQLTGFTSNLQTIDAGIARVRTGAATALYDAIYLGSRSLSGREGRKVMVVVTDGGDTMSQEDYQTALRAAQQAEAMVYSIIIVPIESSAGRDTGGEHALIQISNDTGGKYFYASGMGQLDEAFRKVSEELRTQYLLGYYPVKRFASSDFRRLDVDVKQDSSAGPLQARHRTGYYTSKDE